MTHWEEKYRNRTIPWDRGAVSPALLGWLDDGMVPDGRILIPGCGLGHEALELAQRGFRVTALDIAPTALEHLAGELRAAGVEAERVCADALTWQAQQPFDAIYEQTCLCALDPGQWPAYEHQLYDWLRPGGKLLALFMQTERAGGPPYHCGLRDMQTLFPPTRWQWPQEAAGRVGHPNGFFEFAAAMTRLD